MEPVLEEYRLKGFELTYLGPVKSGKEATVHAVGCGEKTFALKVYVDPALRAFQKTGTYFEGRFFRRPSVRKAIRQRNRFGKRFLHGSWVRREFFLLSKLAEAGANIPKVFDWTATSVLMEFIGEGADPAPRLIDIRLTARDAEAVLETLLKNVRLFLDAGIVHGDLSPYNVLWWRHQPFVIDFPQAIDVRTNPHSQALLKRDLRNLAAYFAKIVAVDLNEIYSRFGV